MGRRGRGFQDEKIILSNLKLSRLRAMRISSQHRISKQEKKVYNEKRRNSLVEFYEDPCLLKDLDFFGLAR